MRPVHFLREGVFLSLSLPFLAGLLFTGGPLASLVGEVVVLLLATVVRPGRRKVFWLGLNLPIVMTSSALGGLSWWALGGQHWSLRMAAFFGSYLVVNYLLVNWMNRQMGAQHFGSHALDGLRSAVLCFGVYLLTAIGIGVSLRGDALWIVPMILIPIELLRRIISEHKLMDDQAYETMVALTVMLQRAHPYTHGHLERVGRLAEDVGRRLGLPATRATLLRKAAVLHDIGKIGIDEEVLDKPTKLTEAEYEHVKQHSEFGARILSHSDRFQAIVPWIKHHHERPDGNGYPSRLGDKEIPLESKVIAVSDAYDAMAGTEKRSYRDSMTPEEAIAELERCSGTQFDRRVVEVFIEALRGGVA
ncbi:MAG: HD-GYP domain-containing protein [Chthonomonas sp.]|nr:HD-GYP domain-containing protein [Chthonomonas sp.]